MLASSCGLGQWARVQYAWARVRYCYTLLASFDVWWLAGLDFCVLVSGYARLWV